MTGFWQDVRFAWRMLLKSPGFTAVVVIAMGLGIGVTTMVFSFVNALLFRDLPLPHAERIVALETRSAIQDAGDQFSSLDFDDLRSRTRTLESVSAYYGGLALVNFGGEAERLRNALITPGLLRTIGLTPALGREFLPEEGQFGHQYASVIISHRIWRQRFGADPNILGKTLRMNGRVRAIVGVMPRGVQFPEIADFWMPLAFDPADADRSERYLQVLGRLAPGATVAQAQAEMASLAGVLAREHPETDRGWTIRVRPYRERLGEPVRAPMTMLMAAVLFVLLIACANVANMLLARGASRRREIALRAAIGASRGRTIRQLLTEAVLLSLAGGALGVLIATWGNDLVIGSIPIELAWWMHFGVDGTALAFTLVVAVGSGLLFGLAPVVQLSEGALFGALKEGGRSSAGHHHLRMRNGLVVAEIALSLVLLAGAGLMIRSFLRMQEIRGGFDPHGVISGRVTLPVAVYPEDDQRRRFFQDLIPRVAALPGVEAASATSQLPYGEDSWTRVVTREGHERDAIDRLPHLNFSTVAPGYFAALRIRLRAGRDFGPADGPASQRVAIVNQAAARLLWPGQDPLGKRLQFGPRDTSGWRTVVGVVGDVRQLARFERIAGQVYVPHAQEPLQSLTLVVRAHGDPAALAGPLRRLVRERDPDLPLYDLHTMPESIRLAVWESKIYTQLMTFFALVALAIAAVGIYGVMAYTVANRTQEIGVRMAMGAARHAVLRMVIGQGMRLTAIGLGIGLAVGFGVTRLMASLLFGVSATDPPTYLGVVVILAGSALLACWLPALRATRVDPMVALRSE
ncbi:MAG TPA: ABC transporter permease [Dongiaceae bacterium]|nr:ABC transporter permease [Dongiaceae bacterium]